MGTIDRRQLDRLTEALDRNRIQYLHIGKSAAIIHDTTAQSPPKPPGPAAGYSDSLQRKRNDPPRPR